ncbi:MAG: PIN domain-containing protein [Actinobacteria bacterium]|nr:PIN domain-containing protein [Actinomycetota bacterium]
MGLIILDSSVLIALLDSKDRHYKSCTSAFKVSKLESENRFRIFCEFVNTVIAFDIKIAFRSAQIRALAGVSLADAMIISTAENFDAELWTCDKKIIKKYRKVKYLG